MTAQATPRGRSTADLARDANRTFGLARSQVVRLAHGKHLAGRVTLGLAIDGAATTIDLLPYSVRSPRHRVLAQQADGSLVEMPVGPVKTFRGEVRNQPGSVVAANLRENGFEARIILPNGSELWLEPIAGKIPGAQAGQHVVYRQEDVLDPGGTCLAVQVEQAAAGGGTADEGSPETAAAGSLEQADLATDADVEYYQRWGSVSGVQDRIESIINSVNIQYERDTGITHLLGTMIVRTAEPDPYTSTDAQTLLNEFRNHWYNNQRTVVRDTAHLFTGKELNSSTIGIAWLGVICHSINGYGYGVSQSDFNNNYSSATDLTAHELGHNWDAGHCSCTSYTMNPYITSANVFNPVGTIPTITQFRDAVSCLTTVAVAPPADPTGLTATAASSSSIDVTWIDNATDEQGYDLEHSTDGISFSLLVSLGANTTSYTHSGLAASSTHYYRARAYNGAGTSNYSNVDNATTLPPPPPPADPTGLSATAVSESQIDLAWSHSGNDETGFRVERSDDGVSFSQIATTGANQTSYSDTGLPASSTRYYRVRAYNESGNSGYSNTASATTDDPPPFVDQYAIAEFAEGGTVSGTYSDTHESDGVTQSITERESGGRKQNRHSWLGHVYEFTVQPGAAVTVFADAWGGSSEDEFQFEVSTDGGNSYTPMFVVPTSDTGAIQSYSLSPATAGSTLVRVADTDQSPGNLLLDTVFIDQLIIRTDVAPGDPPLAPSSLTAAAQSSSLVRLDWLDESADEFGFEIERSTDNGASWSSLASTGPDTTGYDDQDVLPLSSYLYRVRAFNGAGNSAFSNTASATTPDGPVGIVLESASGYKVKGVQHVDLTWTGSAAATVEIVRDGNTIATVSNNGSYTDNIGQKGGGSYSYQVCESGQANCSNSLGVTF